MTFFENKNGEMPAGEDEKRDVMLDAVRAAFLVLHGARYKLSDVRTVIFGDPDEEYDLPICSAEVAVNFVTRTDEEKEDFRSRFFDEASDEYIKLACRDPRLKMMSYSFYVLSVEEVERDFGGDWDFAML